MIKYLLILVLVAVLAGGVYWYMSTYMPNAIPFAKNSTYSPSQYTNPSTDRTATQSSKTTTTLDTSDQAMDQDMSSMDKDLSDMDSSEKDFDAELKGF